MKKFLFILIASSLLFAQKSFSQTERVIGPVEKRMTDSLCSSISRLDLSKITTQEEAIAAYTKCVEEHADFLNDLATERNADVGDMPAMKRIGMDLAFDLYKMKCEKFSKLSTIMAMKMANKDLSQGDVTIGTLKRIDQKEFNYIVLVDKDNNEKSYIWLRQFPGSEKLMNGVAGYIGKKVKITWENMEVYLPQSKGYYNVKEIKNLDFF
jgi:hypothetical protein